MTMLLRNSLRCSTRSSPVQGRTPEQNASLSGKYVRWEQDETIGWWVMLLCTYWVASRDCHLSRAIPWTHLSLPGREYTDVVQEECSAKGRTLCTLDIGRDCSNKDRVPVYSSVHQVVHQSEPRAPEAFELVPPRTAAALVSLTVYRRVNLSTFWCIVTAAGEGHETIKSSLMGLRCKFFLLFLLSLLFLLLFSFFLFFLLTAARLFHLDFWHDSLTTLILKLSIFP